MVTENYLHALQKEQTYYDALKCIGHGGMHKTIKELQNQYYWESMSFDVHKTISACVTCQKEKSFHKQVTYRCINLSFAWHTVLVDVVGPFETSSSRNKYIIVAIDHLTKWMECRAIKDITAGTQLNFYLNN